ncbi:MAG: helix-turn-helix domain-containing protein [Planctomycetes bacterium]|nr:helix-turn-helix domain-containing protein [Planctomycetota bacterium]
MLKADIGERIEAGLRMIEQRWDVTCTLHDQAGAIAALNNAELIWHCSHHHPYCQKYRRNEWGRNCVEYCQKGLRVEARRRIKPFISNCWKGGSEIVVPIFRDGVHMLTIFAGIFRSKENRPPKAVSSMYESLPELSLKQTQELGQFMHTFALGILGEIDMMHQERSGDRRGQIGRYLHFNICKSVTLTQLSATLNLSVSRTSHLIKELFGIPFQQLVLNERIKRACIYLEQTGYTLEAIAERTGFANHYYMSRQFKKAMGVSPGQHRKRHQHQLASTIEPAP